MDDTEAALGQLEIRGLQFKLGQALAQCDQLREQLKRLQDEREFIALVSETEAKQAKQIRQLERKVESLHAWQTEIAERDEEIHNLKAIVTLLARGIGEFQAGPPTPWSAEGEPNDDVFSIEDAHGNHVMEVQAGEWDSSDDWEEDKKGFELHELQKICDLVNAAEDVSSALCCRPSVIELSTQRIAHAGQLAREALEKDGRDG